MGGNTTFITNKAEGSYGGAIHFSNGTLTISGQASFIKNSAITSGSALYIKHSNATISGYVSISDGRSSSARYNLVLEGAIGLLNSTMIVSDTGHLLLTNNTASEGGALIARDSIVVISGCILCYNNRAFLTGGALITRRSVVTLSNTANCSVFHGNSADRKGGAIYAEWNSFITLTGLQNFTQNSAQFGGALAFSHTSKLILNHPLQAHFIENKGLAGGGAIYYEDSFSRSQCGITKSVHEQQALDCFIELSSESDIRLTFVNNTASVAGTVLYGGDLDSCKLYIGGITRDTCGNRIEGNYFQSYKVAELFENISHIISVKSEPSKRSSVISSDPLHICFCSPNGSLLCDEDKEIKIVRGVEFTLMVVIVGQNKGITPSSVRVSLKTSIQISASQRVQPTGKECTPIAYRLSSNQNTSTLTLFPDGPCRDIERSQRELHISFLPCPDASILEGSECVCENRLQKYTTNCSVDSGSIQRGSTDKFWMGVIYESANDSYEGLILHPSCPFDYCVRNPVSINLDDLDIQCNNNHSGILCGSCSDGYSVAFGTLHCHLCSNDYLTLIIPFAVAGVLLVAFLLLLKFSVAIGTINGLIFYANVVQVNRYIFFPPETTNILTVFIAWLNLDLGIETCFFDGMNVYAFTWIQFLFPFYVWFLIGLIIVLSRYFDVIAKALGKNPVAALATLFLLSYSKILRTIIIALSYTRLDYPDGVTRVVWLYDGNVPYFQRFDHIILGVFAFTVLFVLFLPYTFLLLCGHWLMHFSASPAFAWLNRIKPFMDAYYAPYKKGTRYWTGVALLVRCILFLVFAFNALGNASVNLLAITSVMAGLAGLAWIHNRLYEHLQNDILEASFILNLCIFSAATYHVKETGGSQAGLAYTSVGIAFAIFVYIVLFHVYLRIHKTATWKKIPKPRLSFGRKGDDNEANGEGDAYNIMPVEDSEIVRSPTTTVIELREPMLEMS
jgi:predicted outer membrane repeat protein